MLKKLVVLFLIIAMSFSLFACDKGGSSGSKNPVVVNAAWYQFPNSLDPVSEDINIVNYMIYHVYDRLVRFDGESNDWIPGIAKSWERDTDRSWTFEIDLSYKFHNGDQLTMDDVVYSIERLNDIPKQLDVSSKVESVSYEGNTLRLVGVNEDSSIAHRVLSVAVIVNKKYVEANGDEAIFLKPIGTGPYVVTEFTPGASCSLKRWEDYPFDKPQIEELNFSFIPETATRYMALETGSLQFTTDLTPLEIAAADADPNLHSYVQQTRLITFLFFNCERAPFDNVNVRKALVYAFDREGFCSLAGGKLSYETTLFCGYDDLAYNSPKLPGYDLEKAKEMLAAEGFDESNPLKFTLNVNSFVEPGIEMYQATLKQIGVEMTLNVLEFSAFLAAEGAGDFEVNTTPNRNNGNCAAGDLDRYDINMIGSRNCSRYVNLEAQAIIDKMRVENDPQKTKQMAIELQDIIAENVPMIAIYLYTFNTAMSKDLTGMYVDRNGVIDFRYATYTG